MSNDVDITVNIRPTVIWQYPAKNPLEEAMRRELQVKIESSVENLEEGIRKFLLEYYSIQF